MTARWQDTVLCMLDNNGVTLYDLLAFTFRTSLPIHQHHRDTLQSRGNDFLDPWLEQHPRGSQTWAVTVASETCRDEIIQLTEPNAGFHFRATRAHLEQIETFSMVKMGKDIKRLSPHLWKILGVLLDANPARRRAAPTLRRASTADVEMDLGEIGGEGAQEVEKDQWADLVDDNGSSDSEQSEDEQELAGPQSDSDDQSEGESRRPQKTRRRKQNPARRNAILLAIVSLFVI